MSQMSLDGQLDELMTEEGLSKCGHPNVFGCPNHGEWARALARPLPRLLKQRHTQLPLISAPRECWPTEFVITDDGRAAIRGEYTMYRHS
jgi:hypothetical protein